MLPSSSSSSSSSSSDQMPKLRNSFKLLKSHACKVANFTLQWQELEDHLRFIHSEIESKLQQNLATVTIQNDKNPPSKDLILPQIKTPKSKLKRNPATKTIQNDTNPPSKDLILPQINNPEPETKLQPNFATKIMQNDTNPPSKDLSLPQIKNPESKLQQNLAAKTIKNDTNPPSKNLTLPQIKSPEAETIKSSEIPVMNGKELILYIKEHVKDRILLRDYLFKLFKDIEKPEKLVLEAVKESYSNNEIRSSCAVLLEEFGRVRDEEADDMAIEVREEAKRLAVEWKGKLGMENFLVVWAFLLLLIDFGLVGEFGYDEILKLFDCVSSRERAPELFIALGFADKAPEYIQSLIAKNRRLEAIRFVYAFKLVDQFPPVPLLKEHAKYAKDVAKEICIKGKNSFKAQRNATNREIAALRDIIRCIQNYNLDSEYSFKMLRKQILKLKKQTKEREANTKPLAPTLSQQNNGNKRSAPAPQPEQSQRRRISCKQSADLNASVDVSAPINSKQPYLHQPTTSFGGQGTQNPTPPPRTDAPLQAVPYTYGATSHAHMQHSPDQAALLSAHLSTVAPLLTSSFGNYPCTGSIPITSYSSVLARPYEFASSATIRPRTSSSPGLYERSVATNESSGQFGSAGPATIHPHTSSLPGLYGRSVTTDVSSGQFGLAGSATIRPHTSSLYERSVATNGSFGQFGLAGSAYERSVSTNSNSGQFGLAGSATFHPHRSPRPGIYERDVAANASTNIHFPYYGDQLRTSMYYNNMQASSSNTSFNRSGYYRSNYGVASKFPPNMYHP